MIYSEDIELGPTLQAIFLRALIFMDSEEYSEIRNEAVGYIEQDIRFVASANFPDDIFEYCNLRFHYTDQ